MHNIHIKSRIVCRSIYKFGGKEEKIQELGVFNSSRRTKWSVLAGMLPRVTRLGVNAVCLLGDG